MKRILYTLIFSIVLLLAIMFLFPYPPVQIKDWSDVIGKLGPLIVSSLVGLIGYEQYLISKNNIKINLFDRRIKLYEEFLEISNHIRQYAYADSMILNRAERLQQRAAFLFSPPVLKNFDELRDLAFKAAQLPPNHKSIDDHRNDDLLNAMLDISDEQMEVGSDAGRLSTLWFTFADDMKLET